MPFNTPVTNPEKGPKTTCSTSPSNVVGTTILPNATAANNAIVIAPLAIGMADAFITMINLEQLMFFYRLYYADWYIGLYMLINGLVYSSVGTWLGYKVGIKLQQVMGE